MRNSEDIERIVGGMELAARGGRLVRRAPFGYRNGRKEGVAAAEVDPQTAEVAKAGFRLADAGYQLRAILRVMRDEGMLPVAGRSLGVSGLWKVLTNPYYCGYVRHAGDRIRGAHETIVDEATFERVQARLRERRRPPRRRRLARAASDRACSGQAVPGARRRAGQCRANARERSASSPQAAGRRPSSFPRECAGLLRGHADRRNK